MTKLCVGKSICERSPNAANETWVRGRKDSPGAGLAGGSAHRQPVSLPVVSFEFSCIPYLKQLPDFSLVHFSSIFDNLSDTSFVADTMLNIEEG